MPREINHRPVAAGVTHISVLLPLAQHQAAGAPPQSREQWSSRAFCKVLARTHLMRCTVISILPACCVPLGAALGGIGVELVKNLQLIIACMEGGSYMGMRLLPILSPLEKHFIVDKLLSNTVWSNHHYTTPAKTLDTQGIKSQMYLLHDR